MLCQKSKLTLSLMNPTFLKNWDIFYQPSWTAYFNCISMREEKLNEKHEINKFVEICLKSFDLCIRKTHCILIKKFDNKICKSLYIYIYIYRHIYTSLIHTCCLLSEKFKIEFLFEEVRNHLLKNVCHIMLISFI